jgi:hypothetical protein
MHRARLKCEQVEPGMFQDELVVHVSTTNGSTVAFIVPRTKVEGDFVFVEVTHRNGVIWVTLPTDHPYHAIPVPADNVDESVATA